MAALAVIMSENQLVEDRDKFPLERRENLPVVRMCFHGRQRAPCQGGGARRGRKAHSRASTPSVLSVVSEQESTDSRHSMRPPLETGLERPLGTPRGFSRTCLCVDPGATTLHPRRLGLL